jgi:hypothetical protein
VSHHLANRRKTHAYHAVKSSFFLFVCFFLQQKTNSQHAHKDRTTKGAKTFFLNMVKKSDEMMNVELEEFDFGTQILEDGYYPVFGRRRSGKTTSMILAASLTPFAKSAQHIIIASSPKVRAQWAKIVHTMFIHEPSKHILKTVLAEQIRRDNFCTAHKVTFPEEWKVVLFLDDCGDDYPFMHSAEMKKIASVGRQFGITLFVLVQGLVQMHKECRRGTDGVFSFMAVDESSSKTLHKENASSIPAKQFQFLFGACTQARGMMFINSHPEKLNDVKDTLFWTRVEYIHKDGHKGVPDKVGSDLQWEYSNIYFKDPTVQSDNCDSVQDINEELEAELRQLEAEIQAEPDIPDDPMEESPIIESEVVKPVDNEKFNFNPPPDPETGIQITFNRRKK